jgi:acetolactate synthase-1/3 small subunit
MSLRTFVATVEDVPGVLNRVASLFRRRAFNIVSLTVGRSEREGQSRLTVVTEADESTARRLEANLYKLVDVLHVRELTTGAVIRDMALIKVRCDQANRPAIIQIAEVFHSRVVDMTTDVAIIEITGTQPKIDGLQAVLEPYGILEMVRTGVVAIARGNVDEPAQSDFFPTTSTEQH